MSLKLSTLSTPAAKAEAAKAKTKVEARILTELCWLVGVGLKSCCWLRRSGYNEICVQVATVFDVVVESCSVVRL
jgi:hypothetical protein